MTVEQLREEFKMLKRNACYAMTVEEFDKEVKQLAKDIGGDTPTPEQWVEAAKKVTIVCRECRGSGVYQWGACVNGKMTHSGPCFRCLRKGVQTQEDFKRNWAYDNFGRKFL